MKILFLSLGVYNSLDERSIYTDLLREFKDNGHEIYIATPRERKLRQKTRVEKNEDATFLKIRIGNIRNINLIEKGISTITIESIFLKAIKEYFYNVKFDLVLYATPPITFYKVVEYIKKRDGALTYLMLKDIFPQNSVDLGIINEKSLIHKYFKRKEMKLYEISDFIGCMSKENRKYILDNNFQLDDKKVEILPNTISPIKNIDENLDLNKLRSKYDIPTDRVVYVYGGNLGKPQGIEFLIECLEKNESNEDTFILIVGSGTEYNKLNKAFEKFNFKNSKLMNYIPKSEYDLLIKACDVGLIFLNNKFTIPNFPSRLLSYMDVGIPVISATDTSTDIGKIMEEGSFGISCLSNDVESFNQALETLKDKTLREKMGKNAREFLLNNYTSSNGYKIIMKHFN